MMADVRFTHDLPASADVVIIGGGVLGAATAFYASRAGLRAVVVERRPLLGTVTTTAASGGFRLQFDNPDETALVQESVETFANFADVTGLTSFDIGFRPRGYLFVTTKPETARSQAQRIERQRGWGVADVELLDGEEARYRFPYLDEMIVSARYRAKDGFIAPKQLTYGYARGSQATFLVDTDVTGIAVGDSRVRAVETSRGTIATDNVVICAGPFSGLVARLAGLDLPVTAVRRNKLVMPNVPEVPADAPFVIDEDNGAHWRPAYGGAVLVYTDPTTPPSDPAMNVVPDSSYPFVLLDPASEHTVVRACPFWRQVWERGYDWWALQAGQYTYTHDHRPFLGPTPIDGLHLNTGYSGHGVMGSAGGSRRVIDLLLGRARQADNPFRWDRPVLPFHADIL
jgi:sarcosine oxidase subunit beta